MRIPTPTPFEYITLFGNELHVLIDTQHCAIQILIRAKKLGIIAGKDPRGLAAAALFLPPIDVKSNGPNARSQKLPI